MGRERSATGRARLDVIDSPPRMAGERMLRLIDGGQPPADAAMWHPLPEPVVASIAERLDAVSTPLRIRLITYLDANGATNVQALADECDASQQSVSKALSRLYRNGIVNRRSEGRCVWYALADPTVLDVYRHVAMGLMHTARQRTRRHDVPLRPR